ncbi:hypothetical protein CPLU01_01497 [Colletotrichum plurivorum]|uniref:Uncharacterized protein n=1 Tax=Colletotrichum plurivorum TaxID=2175906 RepID=A0A8H6NP08_9PEZI|nr:hypothetical protein CPLU01_01497 [Colletotrichum plurivorum]
MDSPAVRSGASHFTVDIGSSPLMRSSTLSPRQRFCTMYTSTVGARGKRREAAGGSTKDQKAWLLPEAISHLSPRALIWVLGLILVSAKPAVELQVDGIEPKEEDVTDTRAEADQRPTNLSRSRLTDPGEGIGRSQGTDDMPELWQQSERRGTYP